MPSSISVPARFRFESRHRLVKSWRVSCALQLASECGKPSIRLQRKSAQDAGHRAQKTEDLQIWQVHADGSITIAADKGLRLGGCRAQQKCIEVDEAEAERQGSRALLRPRCGSRGQGPRRSDARSWQRPHRRAGRVERGGLLSGLLPARTIPQRRASRSRSCSSTTRIRALWRLEGAVQGRHEK